MSSLGSEKESLSGKGIEMQALPTPEVEDNSHNLEQKQKGETDKPEDKANGEEINEI